MTDREFDFTTIVNDYADMAFSVAYRLLGSRQDAEDAVQQAFINIYKNRKNFAPEKNLKNWIYTISLNTARDIYRRNKRRKETVILDNLSAISPNREMESLAYQSFVEKILNTISKPQREVLILYYIEGRSIVDIAEILNMSKSNVKVTLFRARKRILNEHRDYHEAV